MTARFVSHSSAATPSEIHDFAYQQELMSYLVAVIDLARQAFPSAALWVSLGQDTEDESHRYIALDVELRDRTAAELVAGQRIWSAGLSSVCPSHHAVYFVLGWR